MTTRDLRAYKALRDTMLEAHPEAFTSDALTERHRRADDYVPRLGLERPDGGHLMLGAWRDDVLLGAVGLERDERIKVRHIGHVVSMMVRESARGQGIGRALLDALIDAAREPAGLEMLTLTRDRRQRERGAPLRADRLRPLRHPAQGDQGRRPLPRQGPHGDLPVRLRESTP